MDLAVHHRLFFTIKSSHQPSTTIYFIMINKETRIFHAHAHALHALPHSLHAQAHTATLILPCPFCLISPWQLFHAIFHSSWHLFQLNFHSTWQQLHSLLDFVSFPSDSCSMQYFIPPGIYFNQMFIPPGIYFILPCFQGPSNGSSGRWSHDLVAKMVKKWKW